MDNEVKITKIPIDPNGRYIILLGGLIECELMEIFSKALREWWESQDPVFVFSFHDMQMVEIVKLETAEQ